MSFFVSIRIGLVFLKQLSQRLPSQAPPVLEVALDDPFSLGMGGEPRPTMAQKLLDFVLADPVVLFVIENRY